MEWLPYMGDRLILKHSDGFFVIKPSEMSDFNPLFCPVCDGIMRSAYDEESYKKYECCDSCANKWVYTDVERWNSGWRPPKG